MTQIDFAVLNWIQATFQCSFCDTFWQIITFCGNAGCVWLLMDIFLIIYKPTRKYGISILVTMLCCFLVFTFLLKGIIKRPRPYQQNPAFTILIPEPSGLSFPSGHTSISFCAATIIFLFRKEMKFAKYAWIPSLVLAALIGFSRLYLYVHFPSDVIAGVVVGIIFGTAGYLAHIKIYRVKS